jgi:hypothetical protein
LTNSLVSIVLQSSVQAPYDLWRPMSVLDPRYRAPENVFVDAHGDLA